MEKLESNSTLPDSWINVEWSQITALDGFRRGPFGGNLKKSCFVEEGYSVYEQYAPINDDCTSFRYFIDEEKYQELSGFHVNEGDFLISCSGTMGRITHVPDGSPSGVINQALLRIRLQDQFILPDYFLKLFRSPLIQNSVLNKTVGGAIQNLAAVKELKTIPLPIAPLPEQKRIVEKLDSLLAQVDTIQQRLNNLPNIIKRFRQSVLAAAVSGKLTEQWRENNESKHESVKLGDLIQSGPQNGIYKPSKFYGKGTKIVRIDSIYDGELISWEKIKCLELESEELKRYQVNISDILINRVNSIEYLGKCGLVRELPESAVFESNIMRLSLNINIASPEFVTLFLTSPTGLVELRKNAKLAVNQASINQTDVKNCELILPLLNEQTEIVRLVEQYFALADTLEKNLANAKQRVDNLTQSILAKAFKGELVPQDPSDEPADKLLQRIKAARIEAEKLEKAAKKAAKASKAKKTK